MSVPQKRWIAVALLVVLGGVVSLSLLALRLVELPLPLAVLLLPGQFLDFVLHAGNVHSAERDSTVFLNIAVWALLLGGAAIFLLRAAFADTDRALSDV